MTDEARMMDDGCTNEPAFIGDDACALCEGRGKFFDALQQWLTCPWCGGTGSADDMMATFEAGIGDGNP
jgi:hypothetical protein